MPTAGDLVERAADCVRATDSVLDVARKMRDLDVCSLPACERDDAFRGVVTCRALVFECLAQGLDPRRATALDVVQGHTPTVDADSSAEEVLVVMAATGLTTVAVVKDGKLMGVVEQATVAGALPVFVIEGGARHTR